MEAMEKQVDISQEQALQLGLNQKIQNIRAILDESGEFTDYNEKHAMRKKLFEPGMSGRLRRMSLIWPATYSFNIILALSYIVVGIVNQHLSPDY